MQLGLERPEWSIMVGPEELFVEAVSWGGHGGVLGGANLYPKLLVQLFHAVRARDFNMQNALETRLNWFHQHVLQLVPRTNGWLIGLKTALALQGLCQEHFAEPLHTMTRAERSELHSQLIAYRETQEF